MWQIAVREAYIEQVVNRQLIILKVLVLHVRLPVEMSGHEAQSKGLPLRCLVNFSDSFSLISEALCESLIAICFDICGTRRRLQ
jgi:hypothetical protein